MTDPPTCTVLYTYIIPAVAAKVVSSLVGNKITFLYNDDLDPVGVHTVTITGAFGSPNELSASAAFKLTVVDPCTTESNVRIEGQDLFAGQNSPVYKVSDVA